MAGLTQTVLATVVVMTLACSARPGDYQEHFTQEVERICADYCTMNLDCREPAAFGSKGGAKKPRHEDCASLHGQGPSLFHDLDGCHAGRAR